MRNGGDWVSFKEYEELRRKYARLLARVEHVEAANDSLAAEATEWRERAERAEEALDSVLADKRRLAAEAQKFASLADAARSGELQCAHSMDVTKCDLCWPLT